MHTCGITSRPVLNQGHGVIGLLLNNTGGRLLSRAMFGDGDGGYALCGDFDDVVRVVGGDKLPWGWNGTAVKYRELGP